MWARCAPPTRTPATAGCFPSKAPGLWSATAWAAPGAATWPAPWPWSTSKKSCWREDLPQEGLRDLLVQAVTGANDAVYQLAQEREELRGMGTTAVVLVATQGGLHVAHVGDSRAYLKNGEGFRQITMDHSYVQDLVNFGQITKEEARVHPRRNIITRVLGVHPTVECDYDRFDFAPGDAALACSDGLSGYTEDSVLDHYLEEYREDGQALAKQLIQYAVDKGGSDNITVAIVRND